MSLRIKLMAAAVAMAASAGASADMNTIAGGNSSLAFVALDSVGSPISVMMDLGTTVDSIVTANAVLQPGLKAADNVFQWNFNTNTFLVNGVAQSGTYSWSDNLAAFNAVAQTTETKWGIIAGDSLSTAQSTSATRYLSTSTAKLGTVDDQTLANLAGWSQVNALYAANNLIQTDGVVDGSTATTGSAYVGTPASFGLTGNWTNKTNNNWSAYANVGATQNFYSLAGIPTKNPLTGTMTLAQVMTLGHASYQDGILTLAVPEPETYAMLLAGLGMIGAIARRRKSA